MKGFTHLKSAFVTQGMHISHLHKYVSAYETTEEAWTRLRDDIEQAYQKARRTKQSQYLDHDGEMFIEITPAGFVTLCLRWKCYEIIREK